MTYLRHASRHVHHTVAKHVETQLTAMGWTDDATTPYGSKPAKVTRTPAIAGSTITERVTAGTVAITLGDEYGPELEEMGGPQSTQEYPIFIDVFQDSDAAALVLASDIRDILLGRLPGAPRWIDVINQATQVAVPGWKIEFDDVDRVSPETVMPLRWQVVKVTAIGHFADVIQGA